LACVILGLAVGQRDKDDLTANPNGRCRSHLARLAVFAALTAGVGACGVTVTQCPASRTRIVFESIETFTSSAPTTPLNLYDFRIRVNVGTRSMDFPASVYARGIRCSANFVGEGVMLTAAHCFREQDAFDDDGHATWFISIKLPKTGVVSGKCERPKEFKDGEAYDKANVAWDWALCKVNGSPKKAPFEVINVDKTLVTLQTEVLLTGFGIDPANKVTEVGEMRVGPATVVDVTTNSINTCGSSLDDGDSGAGTFVYFDKMFKHRVQIAVNSRKNADVCGKTSEKGRSSSMLGLWRAEGFIKEWSGRHKRRVCGVHEGAANCRSPSLSTVTHPTAL
jgi:hypothetical protein